MTAATASAAPIKVPSKPKPSGPRWKTLVAINGLVTSNWMPNPPTANDKAHRYQTDIQPASSGRPSASDPAAWGGLSDDDHPYRPVARDDISGAAAKEQHRQELRRHQSR